ECLILHSVEDLFLSAFFRVLKSCCAHAPELRINVFEARQLPITAPKKSYNRRNALQSVNNDPLRLLEVVRKAETWYWERLDERINKTRLISWLPNEVALERGIEQ